MIRIADMARAITPTQIREVTKLAKPTSLHLGIGQPDLPFPESVRDALVRYANDRRAPYVPNAGTDECRAAIAHDVGCEPSEVLVTCGVQEALAVALCGTVQRGDHVLMSDPCFPAYPNLVRALGAEPVSVPMHPNWRWRLDVVESLIKKHHPTALILNNPSNPTGICEDPTTIDALADMCAKNDVTIISDEIYERFTYDGATFRSPRSTRPSHTILLGGLSKSSAMMGLRLGWIVAPADVVTALTPLHQHLVTSAPGISMAAAIAAIEDQASQASMVATMKARAELATKLAGDVLDALPAGTGFMQPNGAFYLMLGLAPVGEFVDDVAVAKRLLDAKDVVTIPGSGFGECGRSHLRIAYTVESDILTEAFSRIHQFFSENEYG